MKGITKYMMSSLYLSNYIHYTCSWISTSVCWCLMEIHFYKYITMESWCHLKLMLSWLLGMLSDQFIACGKSRDMAHELASQIWLAVLDNLEETEHTFQILKRLAQEGDVRSLFYLYYPCNISLLFFFSSAHGLHAAISFWAGFSSISILKINQSPMEGVWKAFHWFSWLPQLCGLLWCLGLCKEQVSANTIHLVRSLIDIICISRIHEKLYIYETLAGAFCLSGSRFKNIFFI